MDIVSACLLGFKCRYDGKNSRRNGFADKFVQGCVVPVCPEQLGGLGTPRARITLVSGSGERVLSGGATARDAGGRDVTEAMKKGAAETLEVARVYGAKRAWLKQKSPSCGRGLTYIDDVLVEGSGVTAALLAQFGIEIVPVD